MDDECNCSRCTDDLNTLWYRQDPHDPTFTWVYVRYKSGKTECLGKHQTIR